ncbi:MAG: WecB/TagA/CpsF family glycosyltransferase [Trueperaceae bacterium]|nr:WecB/TagA/CpsF family glycosyltransferase [Trueperaceae bacterium]
MPPDDRGALLGFPLDRLDLPAATERVLALADADAPAAVVTLNPELVVRARRDAALADAVRRADLVVPDGVGVVWAARRAGLAPPGRVPGVELAQAVLARAGDRLPTFLVGGRPGVADRAAERIRAAYGTHVVGTHDGYFPDADGARVADAVRASGARLLLVGLGERQERFVDRHRAAFGRPCALSLGGTLDVLAGDVRRTPAWTRRAGVEWAWRIAADPARWHRAPRLARFAWIVLRTPAGGPRS